MIIRKAKALTPVFVLTGGLFFLSACEPATIAAVGLGTVVAQPQLDLSITDDDDEQLSGSDIDALIRGRTVYSRSLTDPSMRQVGRFSNDQSFWARSNGEEFRGSWETRGNRLCYELSDQQFCSYLVLSKSTKLNRPIYYFRRASGEQAGEPTLVIVEIR